MNDIGSLRGVNPLCIESQCMNVVGSLRGVNLSVMSINGCGDKL